ncbi:AMP-binding protein [Streptacidiphilus sp. 4-A2]|nr:AMP-binding protein [Streptacidiphilus sp. 4-A2]
MKPAERPDGDRPGGHGPGLERLFARQAARTPASVALVYQEQRITYAQLDGWSNRLARHLRARGVAPGGTVTILLERSPQLVSALLAVLKAGSGYTLLAPGRPVGLPAPTPAPTGAVPRRWSPRAIWPRRGPRPRWWT